jgi:hypothetical protein
MIPETLHHLADAIAALQKADEATEYGLVSDHIRNAEAPVFKVLRWVGREELESLYPLPCPASGVLDQLTP